MTWFIRENIVALLVTGVLACALLCALIALARIAIYCSRF